MTSLDEFLAIQSKIWSPFGYAMRLTTQQTDDRNVLFGLFSRAYVNSVDYLTAINDFELALIVDEYNQNIAELDAQEQNTILDIVTKRYIANVDRLIHEDENATKRLEIAGQNAEWDAKIEALEADQAAITTLMAKLEAEERVVEARIETLEAQIILEGVDLQLQTAANTEKELEILNAENRLAGKEIDLSVKDVEISEKDIVIAAKAIELLEKDSVISEKDNQIQKIQLEESRTELKILETGIDVLKIQLQVVEAGLKTLDVEKEAAQLQIQSANYDSEIAKTDLIEVDLAETEIEKTLANVKIKEMDVQIVEAQTEINKVELQKKEIDLDVVNLEKDIANINIDIGNMRSKIVDTELIQAQLEQESAEYQAEQDKLALYTSKVTILEQKRDTLIAEVAAALTRLDNESSVNAAELDNIRAQHQFKIDGLGYDRTDKLTDFEERITSSETSLNIVKDTRAPSESLVEDAAATRLSQLTSVISGHDDTLTKAAALLEAVFTTTLQHSIGKANE